MGAISSIGESPVGRLHERHRAFRLYCRLLVSTPFGKVPLWQLPQEQADQCHPSLSHPVGARNRLLRGAAMASRRFLWRHRAASGNILRYRLLYAGLLVYSADHHILSSLAAVDLVGSSRMGLLASSPLPWCLAVRASQRSTDELRALFLGVLVGDVLQSLPGEGLGDHATTGPDSGDNLPGRAAHGIPGSHGGDALNLVQKLSLCILLLYWLEVYDQFLKKFFAYLATVSFGIYFIHPYVVWCLPSLRERQKGGSCLTTFTTAS